MKISKLASKQKQTFLDTFMMAVKRKFDKEAARSTDKLLNRDKFKPFLAEEIEIKDDPVSPPKRPKMDAPEPVPKPNPTNP